MLDFQEQNEKLTSALLDAAAIADDGGGGVFPLVFTSAFFALDDLDLKGLIFAAKNVGGGS